MLCESQDDKNNVLRTLNEQLSSTEQEVKVNELKISKKNPFKTCASIQTEDYLANALITKFRFSF